MLDPGDSVMNKIQFLLSRRLVFSARNRCMLSKWCWRRLLRVLWTARRSNQSILKEINHEYSLEGLMLKLKYLGHLMERVTHWKRPWCWERQGKKRRERQRIRWLDSITDSMDMNLGQLQETVKDRKAWCVAVRGVTKNQTGLSNWMTTTKPFSLNWPMESTQS